MAKEICISTTPHETRLAVLEDDQLAEIYYERENEYTLAGSIYKGRVTRVLPGMQSSFVDVGLERDAFLYVTDFLEEQEDSEDYVAESNRRPRQDAPSGEDAEPEREFESGAERAQDRSAEKTGEGRSSDRQSSRQREDRHRAAAAPTESTGRAGRERAREQAVAPLREAVPAPQDLEEKGDEELPGGTRRWRGRRGRRRGVRAGISDVPSSLSGEGLAEPVERMEASGEVTVESFATPERGAPGGIADPYLGSQSLALKEEPAAARTPGPQGSQDAGRGRERSGRRSREPYAQASTLVSREQPAREQPTPVTSSAPATGVDAIVLPGESLSKYGSSPLPAPVAAVTASVPRAPARPVNYVAAKPSTLVELGADWDGGAVLPGETISRYRGAAAEIAPVPAESRVAPAESYPPAGEVETDAPVATGEAIAPDATPPETLGDAIGLDQVEAEDAPHAGTAEQPHAPLAEPEVMTAAVTVDAEAGHTRASMPELALESAHAQVPEPEEDAPTEPVEYEPESASASFRVPFTSTSEMRLAPVEPEPEAVHHEAEAENAGENVQRDDVQLHQASGKSFYGRKEPEATFVETTGPVAESDDAVAESSPEQATHVVPEFGGALEASAAETGGEVYTEVRASHAISILHQDGTIETVSTSGQAPSLPSAASMDMPPEVAPQEEPGHVAEAAEAKGFEGEDEPDTLDWASHVQQADAALSPTISDTPFSDMVEKLQGYSAGNQFTEEEVVDEDEYDFEPLHAQAHGDDGDHEDLEEETLDQSLEPAALSDAIRESHLNQRVHEQQPEAANAETHREAEGHSSFDMEELEEEGEDDQTESPAEGGANGEPSREGRSAEDRSANRERGRGRGGPRPGGRAGGGRNGGRGRSAQTQDLPVISDMLKQGQEILVQIAKEPIAKKGARITSHIALPGRFLVFMPTVSHVGVSRKIASDEERQRLKRILISEKGDSSGGFIVRTAAEGAGEEDLRADLRFLISLWTEIKQRSDAAKAPALIYHDLNLIERILRDQVSSNFSTIWVDSESEYERIIRFLNRFQPTLVRRVKLYTKETPLFEHFGIQEEISKALKSKVWLKSGGSIVINQTEALVAIDINTGKYVGKTSRLEDTIVKTNLDAIPEIVRQIRLRDLGGIIVIDFIDMDERKNRNRVLAALEEELKHDRAPSKVLQFNDFGLVAITRKRVKQSLERTLSVQCETCTGTGMVKSPVTVCNEIYIEMRKMQKHLDGKDVMLRVHPEVVKQLKAGGGKWINELEEMVAKTIIIKSDPALHPEQFDIH